MSCFSDSEIEFVLNAFDCLKNYYDYMAGQAMKQKRFASINMHSNTITPELCKNVNHAFDAWLFTLNNPDLPISFSSRYTPEEVNALIPKLKEKFNFND